MYATLRCLALAGLCLPLVAADAAAQAKPGVPDPNAPPPPVPKVYLDKTPPGWLPVNRLDDQTPWNKVNDIADKAQIYFPNGDRPVRGVYLSVVFHSQDPRELARLWDFALVTIPWPMLYDVGLEDKRSPRAKQTGYPIGNMGFMLHYLEKAAAETKHPELATVPIVGWLMQSGYNHAPDLLKRVPNRVIAWSDAFGNQLRKHEDCLAKLPYVIAWEFGPNNEKQRLAEREAKLPELRDKPTPSPNLLCEASTYDFPHGVYSKWNLFAIYLDRCIKTRMPATLPSPGQPVAIAPVDRESGWCADFNAMSEWVPIAPYREAKGMVSPQWLPDEYAAWAYRAFHSKNPDLMLTAPVTEYMMTRAAPGGDRGICGLGYGKLEGKAGEAITLEAGPRTGVAKEKVTPGPWPYAKVEFYDGNKPLGVADKAPWKIEGVKLEPGLHALIAVGVKADGTRTSSRLALYGVR